MINKLLTIGATVLLFSCTNSTQNVENKVSATLSSNPSSQATEKPVDFLNVPGPIKYNQEGFNFSWSSHPSNTYFKQEYLPVGENSKKYNQMITLELVLSNMTLKDVSSAKAAELEKRKATDIMANYEVSENKKTGEILLDFIVSQGNDNANSIVEWNAYRYAKYSDKLGNKGIILLGLSKRGYGMKTTEFLSDIKLNRKKYISSFVTFGIPEIKLKK